MGVNGSFQVAAAGVPSPTFSTGGPLPSGVSLSPGGLLGGVPGAGTGGQTFPFVLTATNGVPPDATQSFTLVINRPPTTAADVVGTRRNVAAQVAAAKLLRNDADPDGDALTLSAVNPTSAQGGTVTLAGSTLTYLPPSGYVGADTFTYTVTDGRGGSATGTVNVTVTSDSVPSLNIVSIAVDAGGTRIVCQGVPGLNYRIQSTDNLAVPFTDQSGPLTADSNGRFQYQDPRLPGQQPPNRFYRAVLVP